MRSLAPTPSAADLRALLLDLILVALLCALVALIASCAPLRELVNTPVDAAPGGRTVGDELLSAGASGLATANPLAGVAALFGGRLLLGALRKR